MAFRGSWGDEVLEWGSARWGKMVLEGAAVGSGGWVKLCHASGVHHWKEEVEITPVARAVVIGRATFTGASEAHRLHPYRPR